MEEAVCTVADGLVAINAARTDDAERGLLHLHDTALDGAGVSTQDDVGMALDEEGVLHVSCGMIFSEIHG